MNDLKLSRGRGQQCVCLILLSILAVTISAGEAKHAPPVLAKPVRAPFSQPLTTFRADLTLPHPQQQIVWQPASEPQPPLAADAKRQLAVEQEPLTRALPVTPPHATNAPQTDPRRAQSTDGVQWKPLIGQSLTFLWIAHGFRFMTEPGTREELRGPFFKDWFNSVKKTRGWRDGDPFIVNYIGHPMQGSVTNYIFVHNDPKYLRQEIGFTKAYFKSRLRAMLFSTVYSTQFELGPLSEASLGNVGLHPSQASRHPSALVDLVITPTLGTAWMMGEDALDRYLIKRMENHVDNRVVRLLVRSFLNPSRSFANAMRGKYPWNRDGRRL